MMERRTFLWAPLAVLSAQSAREGKPRLAIEWITGEIPESFAQDAVVFARAYTTCPQRDQAEWALEHGRFPHVPRTGAQSVWDFFEKAPVESADVAVMVAHAGEKTARKETTSDATSDDDWREGSVHAPLAIRWRPAGIESTSAAAAAIRPRVTGVLCSQVDVLPVLLGVALGGTLLGTKIAEPDGLHGRDVLGVGADEAVYIEGGLGTRREWRALVRGYDKLVWTFDPDAREEITGLYNVSDDPEEKRDLHDKVDHRLLRDSMWALAERWMDRLEDGRDPNGLRTRRAN